MNKISIIIPTYNNSKYLKRCVDSVLNQSYNNIEIIVIDDGSTDDTNSVMSEYKNTKKVKYVKQSNGGVSSARNNGLKMAHGDYIMFLDSDDYFCQNYCEKMLSNIVKNNSDICLSGINYIKNDKSERIDFYNTNKLFNTSEIKNLISDNIYNYLLYPVWNKIYNKKILESINFDTSLIMGEDFIFNLQCLCNCKKVSYITENYYNYVINNNSTTSKMRKYNTIISIENEINYSKKVDSYLNKIGLEKKIIEKRKKWNYSLSYNKICNNIFAKNNPYKSKERKKIINEIKKSEIGLYSRKNINSFSIFILSHSKILTYIFYAKKNSKNNQ